MLPVIKTERGVIARPKILKPEQIKKLMLYIRLYKKVRRYLKMGVNYIVGRQEEVLNVDSMHVDFTIEWGTEDFNPYVKIIARLPKWIKPTPEEAKHIWNLDVEKEDGD